MFNSIFHNSLTITKHTYSIGQEYNGKRYTGLKRHKNTREHNISIRSRERCRFMNFNYAFRQ